MIVLKGLAVKQHTQGVCDITFYSGCHFATSSLNGKICLSLISWILYSSFKKSFTKVTVMCLWPVCKLPRNTLLVLLAPLFRKWVIKHVFLDFGPSWCHRKDLPVPFFVLLLMWKFHPALIKLPLLLRHHLLPVFLFLFLFMGNLQHSLSALITT